MKYAALLKRIADNSILFLGAKSLERMHSFLGGYAVCASDNGFMMDGSREFQDFVEKKFNCNRTIAWTTILQEQCENDADAFELFLNVLNEYEMMH